MKLQQFRAGGFTVAYRVDCEVWMMVNVGNSDCWPAQETFGGYPASIRYKMYKFSSSTHDLLTENGFVIGNPDTERGATVFLADTLQSEMQEQMNSLDRERSSLE